MATEYNKSFSEIAKTFGDTVKGRFEERKNKIQGNVINKISEHGSILQNEANGVWGNIKANIKKARGQKNTTVGSEANPQEQRKVKEGKNQRSAFVFLNEDIKVSKGNTGPNRCRKSKQLYSYSSLSLSNKTRAE